MSAEHAKPASRPKEPEGRIEPILTDAAASVLLGSKGGKRNFADKAVIPDADIR